MARRKPAAARRHRARRLALVAAPEQPRRRRRPAFQDAVEERSPAGVPGRAIRAARPPLARGRRGRGGLDALRSPERGHGPRQERDDGHAPLAPVPGEALFLFAPDGGVGDSDSHPFRVARFSNNTGGVLERGPIAVFEDGSFLGQGMVDPLPDGATATVPFALERSIAIDVDRKCDELGARSRRSRTASSPSSATSVTQTKYRVRNGGDKVAKVLVKHPRQNGARLFSPPKDTEDNVGTGTALVPANVPPHTTVELVVDERTPTPPAGRLVLRRSR